MKQFYKIYFPIVAFLIVLTISLSLVGASGLYASSSLDIEKVRTHAQNLQGSRHSSFNKDNAVTYISGKLKEYNFSEQNDDLTSAGLNTASIPYNASRASNAYVVQSTTLTTGERNAYYSRNVVENDIVYPNAEVKNVIAILPAVERANAVKATAILVPIDTAQSSGGAASASAIGAALETIFALRGGIKQNDLLFVFYPSSQGQAGAIAFLERFVGFDNAVSRLEAVAVIQVEGNGGAVMLSTVHNQNGTVLSLAHKSTLVATSIDQVFASKVSSATDILPTNLGGIGVSSNGGKTSYNTANDNNTNLSDGFIKQVSAAVFSLAHNLSENNISLKDSDTPYVYYSYLSFINLAYSVLAAMILLSLIVGLIAAIVVCNIKLKAFTWKNASFGLIASLCTLASVVATLYIVYMLFALIFAAYGIFNIHYFFTLVISSGGLTIAAILVTLAASLAYSLLFKRVFALRAYDMTLGNAVLNACLAITLGLIIPQAAYALVAFSTLQLATILVNTIFKAKFKAKFNAHINSLFLVFVPLIIALPLVVSSAYAVGQAVGVSFYPLIYGAVALVICSVTPFAALLEPHMHIIFEKLPHHTVRIKRKVEEVIPDKTRKNRSKTVVVERIFKEKRATKYRASYFVTAISLVAVVLIVAFSVQGNIYTNPSTIDHGTFYENALVYHQDNDKNTGTWQIRDLDIYRTVQRTIDDMTWNSEQFQYEKQDRVDYGKNVSYPLSSSDGKTLTVTPRDAYNSTFHLQFNMVTMPQRIIIRASSGKELFNYVPRGHEANLEVSLPSQIGNFEIQIEGSIDTSIMYTEYNTVASTLSSYSDWIKLSKALGDDSASINPHLMLTKTIHFAA